MWKDSFLRASSSDLVQLTKRYQAEKEDDDFNASSSKIKSLKRVFRLFDLVIYGMSLTVGSGIYLIAGTAGKDYAGSSLVLSLLIGCFSSMCTSMAFAEFSSRIPIIGSVYTYNYNASGEFIAFLAAWQGILDPLGASINAIGAVGYFKSFLISCGISRQSFIDNPIWFGDATDSESFISINLCAPILIIILTLFALFDVGLSKNFLNIFSVWNISLLLLFILCGLFLIDRDIWSSPCDHMEFGVKCPTDAKNSFFPFGIEGTLSGGLIATWAFMGCENIVSVAEECINPIRDIPRSIYISLILVTILYVLVILVINGLVPFQAMDTEASLAESLAMHNELLLHQMISFGASTTMSILSFAAMVASSRRWFRVGVDGLCFPIFSYIHPKYRTPFYSILLYSIIATLAALLFDLGSVMHFSAVSALLVLTSVSCGLLIVRYSPPDSIRNEINDVYWWSEMKLIALSWSYFLICLIFAYIGVYREYIDYGLWISLTIIFGLLILAFIALFCYFHYKYPWKRWLEKFRTFKIDSNDGNIRKKKRKQVFYMPLCPYLPCLLILLNSFLMAGIGLLMMAQLMIVLLIGVPIYFGYSYKHSELRKENKAKKISTMIALTAIDHDDDDIIINDDRRIDDVNVNSLLNNVKTNQL